MLPLGDPKIPEDPKENRRVLNLERRTHILYASYTLADMKVVRGALEDMIENRTVAVYYP